MKRLLFFLSICTMAGCQPAAEKLTPMQEQVTAYIKKNADDPESYQPVRWTEEKVYRKQDDNESEAKAIEYEIQTHEEMIASSQADKARLSAKGLAGNSRIGINDNIIAERQQQIKELRARQQELRGRNDTALIGHIIRHTYRIKNKMGALELDSTIFVKAPDGTITTDKQ